MAVESKYHEKIKTFMRTEGRPVTLREIMEGVGISRPAVYQWKDRHSRELREMGPGKFSAMSYELAEDAGGGGHNNGHAAGTPRDRRRRQSTEALDTLPAAGPAVADIAAGMTLVVSAVRLMAGHVVLDVSTEAGERLAVAIL